MANPKSVTLIFTLEQVKAIANESGTFLNIVMNSLDHLIEGMTIDADTTPTPANDPYLAAIETSDNKIDAIKKIRTLASVPGGRQDLFGLKDAKEFVEKYERLAKKWKPFGYPASGVGGPVTFTP